MKANNLMSTRIPRLASLVAWIAFFLALLMPLVVALLAFARPYDAVPDQDLIWVSDALKLFREIPPSTWTIRVATGPCRRLSSWMF